MKYLVTLLVLILVGGGSYASYQYIAQQATQLPANSPSLCEGLIRAGNKHLVVALGDSITHGRVSGNYVQILAQQDNVQSYTYVNAGINSRLAFNALQIIDSVVACQPSFVTILIGTNDVLATASDEKLKYYMDKWQLSKKPDFTFYKDSLIKIIDTLQLQTTAKIGIFSLPPIGENENSKMNLVVAQYNGFIKALATERELAYLPLNERMWQTLNEQERLRNSCPLNENLMEGAIASHYLLGKSWDEISAGNDLHLLTDCVHLNDRGAKIVAQVAKDFLTTRLTQVTP